MGNYRFRLFDMVSNSWFCKHKFMDRANGSQSIQQAMKKSQTSATTAASAATLPPIPQHKEQDYLPSRTSYYIPSKERREKLPHSPINNMDPQPPRKSKPRTRRKDRRLCDNSVSSATSVSCTCHHTLASVCKIGSTPENGNDLNKPVVAKFDSFHVSSSMTNININMTGSSDSFEKVEDLEVVSELKLPPILTKPVKKKVHKSVLHDTTVLKEHNKIAARRSSPGIRRVKVWQSSPRIGGRNVHASRNQNAARPKVAVQQRRALSESLVVTKSSLNPRRDFTESMVEMIVQNNIREMKDLEDLLACYLSLNSKEYHEVIIKVFERIWFVLNDIRI